MAVDGYEICFAIEKKCPQFFCLRPLRNKYIPLCMDCVVQCTLNTVQLQCTLYTLSENVTHADDYLIRGYQPYLSGYQPYLSHPMTGTQTLQDNLKKHTNKNHGSES